MPTNHVDTQGVEWLTNYLANLTGTTVIIVSHDADFLGAVGEQEKALCKHLAEQIGSDEYSARVGVGAVRAAVEASLQPEEAKRVITMEALHAAAKEEVEKDGDGDASISSIDSGDAVEVDVMNGHVDGDKAAARV